MSATDMMSPEYLAQNIGSTILATASLTIIFSTVFVGLRYYARYLSQTKFGIEDIIIPFAWLAEIGICVTGILMVEKAGTGRHQAYVEMTGPGKVAEHYKGIMIFEILHPPAVAFSKLSVLLLYLKVFTDKKARLMTWVTIFMVAGTWLSFTVASLFQCQPFAFNWDKSIPGGHCFNVIAFSQSSSVPNIVTDVVVLLLPIQTVTELKISKARRIGLLLIFLTGSVGIIASIIRTVVFSRLVFDDVTYHNTSVVNWTIIEPGLYLLAACALSFKPLFHMIAKALHLKHLVTHTRSYVFKQNTTKSSTKTRTQDDMHMETFKSSSSGGFKKLHSGKDAIDEEADIGITALPGIRVTVTRSWEVDEDAHSVPNRTPNVESRNSAAHDSVELSRTIGRTE